MNYISAGDVETLFVGLGLAAGAALAIGNTLSYLIARDSLENDDDLMKLKGREIRGFVPRALSYGFKRAIREYEDNPNRGQ